MRTVAWLAIMLLSMAGCLAPPQGPDRRSDAGMDNVSRLLTNDVDSRIAIHTYYVAGREPAPAAMDRLAGRLKELTGKVEVTVAPFVAISTGTDSKDTNWTGARASVVFRGLDVPEEPGTFAFVVIFFDGYGYTYGARALGFSGGDFVAMFPDAYRGVGLTAPVAVRVPVPDPDGSQDLRILLHESGHMLGLVDRGAPMVRDHVDRSEECACHSSNPESIMATSVDTVTVVKSLVEPRDFDADDLADLKAFQQAAKARR